MDCIYRRGNLFLLQFRRVADLTPPNHKIIPSKIPQKLHRKHDLIQNLKPSIPHVDLTLHKSNQKLPTLKLIQYCTKIKCTKDQLKHLLNHPGGIAVLLAVRKQEYDKPSGRNREISVIQF
jgi:hypothetical protein